MFIETLKLPSFESLGDNELCLFQNSYNTYDKRQTYWKLQWKYQIIYFSEYKPKDFSQHSLFCTHNNTLI